MNVKELAENVIGAVRDYVARTMAPLAERLAQLESRPAPQDGKSVTLDDVRPMVQELVARIPAPADGKSVTLDEVRPMVEEYLQAVPIPSDGKSVTIEDVWPKIDEFLRGIPIPKDGEPGKSVTLEEVRGYLDAEVATWALNFERRAQGVLERAIERMPKPKDGEPGKSVTLEEVRGYLDAEVATWALNFERRAQGVLERAIERMPKPKDGVDGFSLDDLQIEDDCEGTVTLRFMRGELVRERTIRVPSFSDRGVFREGGAYRKGDGVTFGGSFWIAQKDAPEGKPGTSADWRLAVKKGRDGADR